MTTCWSGTTRPSNTPSSCLWDHPHAWRRSTRRKSWSWISRGPFMVGSRVVLFARLVAATVSRHVSYTESTTPVRNVARAPHLPVETPHRSWHQGVPGRQGDRHEEIHGGRSSGKRTTRIGLQTGGPDERGSHGTLSGRLRCRQSGRRRGRRLPHLLHAGLDPQHQPCGHLCSPSPGVLQGRGHRSQDTPHCTGRRRNIGAEQGGGCRLLQAEQSGHLQLPGIQPQAGLQPGAALRGTLVLPGLTHRYPDPQGFRRQDLRQLRISRANGRGTADDQACGRQWRFQAGDERDQHLRHPDQR